MLDADQLRPGILSDKATISIALRVRGPLDLERLAEAYDQLVSRHEVLRSRLVPAASGREAAHAQVEPHRRVGLELVERKHGEQQSTDEALFARWNDLRIDPHEPPLVRGFIAPREPGVHLIGLVFSHIVADPTGLRVAVRELRDLYNARGTGETLPPAAQYSAYAEWEAERLRARADSDRAAWRRILAGSKPARYARQVAFVPGRKAAPVVSTLPVLSKAEVDAITHWSWRSRSTLSITLLAAFARAIREDADRDDLLVSTVFEQRDHPAARDMLGVFLKGTVVRLKVDEDEPMPALVTRARTAVLEAYQRAHLSLLDYASLMPRFVPGAIGLEPSWFRLFQYVPTERGEYRFGEASATIVHLGGRVDPEDLQGLQLGAFHADDGSLHARLTYDTHDLDAQNASRVLDDFRHHALSVVQ